MVSTTSLAPDRARADNKEILSDQGRLAASMEPYGACQVCLQDVDRRESNLTNLPDCANDISRADVFLSDHFCLSYAGSKALTVFFVRAEWFVCVSVACLVCVLFFLCILALLTSFING